MGGPCWDEEIVSYFCSETREGFVSTQILEFEEAEQFVTSEVITLSSFSYIFSYTSCLFFIGGIWMDSLSHKDTV